jgi:uncharacterized peroxidase-related enzyme
MSRIIPLEPDAAEGRSKELLDAVRSTLGSTPNMTKLMARSAVLDGWLGLNRALRRGSIRAADGERIALAMAEANGCSYCLSAHTHTARNLAKLDEAEIDRARRFRSSDPRSAAILAFAAAVVHNKGAVGDDELEAAREAGLSNAQLEEIVGHIALSTLTNYFNIAFDTDIDFPVVVEPALKAA